MFVFYILGIVIAIGIIVTTMVSRNLKGEKRIPLVEMIRRDIVYYSVFFFLVSVVLILLLIFNGLGLSIQDRLDFSAILLVVAIVCAILFLKNKI